MEEEKKTAIIDCDSIMFSGAHPNKVLDIDNQPVRVEGKFLYEEKSIEQMCETIDQIMTGLLENTNSTHFIAYVKGKGNFRYKFNPEYKQNRPKESPFWWNALKQHLFDFWRAFEVNDIEVDDACRITSLNLPNSFIASIDKDLLLLEGEAYNWRLNKWYITSQSEADYKFWYDMIVGQPGDNIKGIPGCGDKFATNFLNQNTVDYAAKVMMAYVTHLGDNKGIEEFYKNYKSLYILKEYNGFIIPDLAKFSKKEEDLI